jgi:ubiquinone/menaquinone biosynthesis C-methylase UbiE
MSTHFYDQVENVIIRPMIAWLCDGEPLNVLDAGCGEGIPALIFAQLGCTVIGVDVETTDLATARERAESSPFTSQVTFLESDLSKLPFENARFDLVWCSYVLHHVADKPQAISELKRVLKPGGRLAIREDGLPIQFLPFDIGIGEPGLQDRLRVANNRWFAAMTRATLPNAAAYPYGWSQLLHDHGFTDVTARTFTLDALSSLDEAHQQFVLYYLQRTLERDDGEYGPFLSSDDKTVLKQLTDPQSEHYVLQRIDLHLRYGLSVYVGTK